MYQESKQAHTGGGGRETGVVNKAFNSGDLISMSARHCGTEGALTVHKFGWQG